PDGGQAAPRCHPQRDRARQSGDARARRPGRFPFQDLPAHDWSGRHRDGDTLLACRGHEGGITAPLDPRSTGRLATVSLPLIDCVPNFSEGRREDVLAALASSIRDVPGVHLLDVSLDPDHNRSVYTFVGRPETVAEAAYRSAAIALQQIDLRTHQG